MKVMKRRRKKEFPSWQETNRFHYPVTEKRTLMGISGLSGIDPALQANDEVLSPDETRLPDAGAEKPYKDQTDILTKPR